MKQEDRDIPDTPETSTPSSGSSERPTKESSQENLRKLTFDRVGGKVSARIRELQEASKTVCVMGSGQCGAHNVKLIKSVKSKKMSCVEPGGNIGWKYADVTCLVCVPVRPQNYQNLVWLRINQVGALKRKGKF